MYRTIDRVKNEFVDVKIVLGGIASYEMYEFFCGSLVDAVCINSDDILGRCASDNRKVIISETTNYGGVLSGGARAVLLRDYDDNTLGEMKRGLAECRVYGIK